MNRLFMGLLAVAALALIFSQATAGANGAADNAANAADDGGVMIIETYTSSSITVPAGNNANANNDDMQPLPEDPNVEVAPIDNAAQAQPVVVEEDMLVQETEDGE